MPLALVLTAVVVLVALIALVQAASSRLALPQSVALAALGIVLGLLATAGHAPEPLAPLAELFRELPLSADALTLILLPPLLFDAAFRIDARRMLDDGASIVLLAVVAVAVSTFAIGFALAPVTGMALSVCLLLGAIVSTTDPLAVLSIFRDVGAPARLVRIVEGESLFNDAAAIALFTILVAASSAQNVTFADGVVVFLVSGIGGAAVGVGTGIVASLFIAMTRGHAAALTSITVALPYLTWVLCEEQLGISGAMAVVVSGLWAARRAQSGRAVASWRHVHQIWEQLSFWSNSLIFVLAAFLVPTLLSRFDLAMALATGVVVLAAFGARALILWGFLPILERLALAQSIEHRAKALLWWGGMRGGLTLLLALSVTEIDAIAPADQEFVAVLATAFTLFTIFVNGLTLRPLTSLVGLTRLSPFERHLGAGARAFARQRAAERIGATAEQYGIEADIADNALEAYRDAASSHEAVPATARSHLALVVLAQAERAALSRHAENAVISPRVAELLNREVQRVREAARVNGRRGYLATAERATRYTLAFRGALLAQRWFGVRRPLAAVVSDRFEKLIVHRLVLSELVTFCADRIAPVMGERVAEVCARILERRRTNVASALDALTLQYPHFARRLEQRFLERVALTEEHQAYQVLREEGILAADVSSALADEMVAANRRFTGALTLDLSVDKRAMVAAVPMFAKVPDATLSTLVRSLRTRFVVPGERIIRRGDTDDEVYFIASGAVEVDTGTLKVTLGRGSCVGEISAVLGVPRSADVTMLGFGELLVLPGRVFRNLLSGNDDLRREIVAVARRRRAETDRGTAKPENLQSALNQSSVGAGQAV
ncbi:cation:proton antiporter [Acuticoccus sp. I52.16.1]|uniref:cation:proton antiporter n=1 Tax=Acuticoccus sp. I52.16.1 TaxID=2928472 RepID=UPI001FD53228|nr:cation:proton antiporter [Acuticoccus sp. I52.16.1]UOM35002.1 cation:proton antiporter [Acuticoccus sp. I52.16.1]